MTEQWVYLNTNFCLASRANISIFDRGFLFGEGVFTTIRVEEGKCELLSLHQQRLQEQAAKLHIVCPIISLALLEELIIRNHACKGIWRLKIILTKQTFLIVMAPYIDNSTTSSFLTLFPYPIEKPSAKIKSLSYLDSLQVKQFANECNYTDAVITNSRGILLETSCSNIFWIDKNIFYLPSFSLPYLQGVFLQALLQNNSFLLQEGEWTLANIPSTASFYTCNALTHVKPVASINRQFFPRDEQLEKYLQESTIQALQMN